MGLFSSLRIWASTTSKMLRLLWAKLLLITLNVFHFGLGLLASSSGMKKRLAVFPIDINRHANSRPNKKKPLDGDITHLMRRFGANADENWPIQVMSSDSDPLWHERRVHRSLSASKTSTRYHWVSRDLLLVEIVQTKCSEDRNWTSVRQHLNDPQSAKIDHVLPKRLRFFLLR